jgi:hypothetical protein
MWWAAFLILTICAERLELGRLVRLTRSQENWFFGGVAVLLLGLVAALGWMNNGTRLIGISLIWLSLWLWKFADLSIWQNGRLWGGLLNGFAILVFFALLLAGQRGLLHAPEAGKA